MGSVGRRRGPVGGRRVAGGRDRRGADRAPDVARGDVHGHGHRRDRIKELEAFGIISSHGPEGARYYDGDDFIILSIVKDFFRYGIEARHLTMYKHFADRESSFFDQIVAPTLRQKNPDARRTAAQTLANLSATSRKFKQALLRTNLRDHLTSA